MSGKSSKITSPAWWIVFYEDGSMDALSKHARSEGARSKDVPSKDALSKEAPSKKGLTINRNLMSKATSFRWAVGWSPFKDRDDPIGATADVDDLENFDGGWDGDTTVGLKAAFAKKVAEEDKKNQGA
ncbi:hypothetical protein EJ04DRAFT_524343 [Polyplosphaeria fusca]|uniref:Uncharacterized protein n=1 Tax=Polyplosphaeria fusca TaxID=682080 RepID=A0A9P4V228_9PLEO|nr:hypothetical protein EJ04DRAFT_524343 [Polyplosphaeria fusca]